MLCVKPDRLLDKVENRLKAATALHGSGKLNDWADDVKWMAARLRDGWELAAESAVAPVIRRYSHKVRTGGLVKLTVLTEPDCTEFDKGFAWSCKHCHTYPAGVNPPTTAPTKMQEEIHRLRDWFTSVKTRQDKK
jgi:hypothetical protein